MKRILIGNLREILDLDNIVSGLQNQINTLSTTVTTFIETTFAAFKSETEDDIATVDARVTNVNNTLSSSITALDNELSGDIETLNTSLTASIDQVNTNLSENIQDVSDSLGEHLNGLKFSVTGEGKLHVELEEAEENNEE